MTLTSPKRNVTGGASWTSNKGWVLYRDRSDYSAGFFLTLGRLHLWCYWRRRAYWVKK